MCSSQVTAFTLHVSAAPYNDGLEMKFLHRDPLQGRAPSLSVKAGPTIRPSSHQLILYFNGVYSQLIISHTSILELSGPVEFWGSCLLCPVGNPAMGDCAEKKYDESRDTDNQNGMETNPQVSQTYLEGKTKVKIASFLAQL